MAIASGVSKKLAYKAESSWGTIPAVKTGAQYLRRTSSDLDMQKATYESAEIRTDFQVADFRHGVRRVEGTLSGELSPATYGDFLAALLRMDFAAGVSASSLTITMDNTAKTATRATGSWLTDGFKIGDTVRFTGFTAGFVGNNSRNYRIVGVTALVLTFAASSVLVNCTSQASITCAVAGKKAIAPASGHTNKSFSIEHWYSDINQSEVFTGCKIGKADISLPSTGMATVGFSVLGKDVTTGTSQYYTSPTAETTTGVLTAVSGTLTVGSTDIAVVTGATITIDAGLTSAEVVGSNSAAAVFNGRTRVSGQMTVYFEDATMRDAFLNETELSLTVQLLTGTDAAANFISITLPRIKVGGAGKGDGEQGIIQTVPFTALLNTAGGTGLATDATTIAIQDSAL